MIEANFSFVTSSLYTTDFDIRIKHMSSLGDNIHLNFSENLTLPLQNTETMFCIQFNQFGKCSLRHWVLLGEDDIIPLLSIISDHQTSLLTTAVSRHNYLNS